MRTDGNAGDPVDAEYADMTSERKIDLRELLFESIFHTIYWLVKYIPSPIGCFLRYLVLKIFMKKIESWKIMEGATFFFPRNISIGKNCFILSTFISYICFSAVF